MTKKKSAQLTPAESRLLDKIVDEAFQNFEDSVNELINYQTNNPWYVSNEPHKDSSLFLLNPVSTYLSSSDKIITLK